MDWYLVYSIAQFEALGTPEAFVNILLQDRGMWTFRFVKVADTYGLVCEELGYTIYPKVLNINGMPTPDGQRIFYIDADGIFWVGFKNDSEV